jgi:hypothetical protein
MSDSLQIVEIHNDEGGDGWIIVQPSTIPGMTETMVFKGPHDSRGWNLAAMGPDHWTIYKTERRAEKAVARIRRERGPRWSWGKRG